MDSSSSGALDGLPIPPPSKRPPRHSGFGFSSIDEGHFRAWVLLASTSRMQKRISSAVEAKLLVAKAEEEHGARP